MPVQDWRQDRLDLSALRGRLAAGTGTPLRVSNVPNGRLGDVCRRVSHLLDRNADVAPAKWVDPRDLERVASEAGYRIGSSAQPLR